MKTPFQQLSLFFLGLLYCVFLSSTVSSFVLPFYSTVAASSTLYLQKGWFAEEQGDENDDDNLVTREVFQRDLLEDPRVKRKRKNGRYKPLDNRDHLPFAVKKLTPDPYTHPAIKKDRRKSANGTKKSDLDRHLTNSRLFKENDEGSTTLLGEFKLDKSTTSGDLVVIGDREFQVQSARCQYRYAGGKRFVMVRKILEVKEVARVAKEEFIMEQYTNSETLESDAPPNLE
jgi:hypothetical protein